MQRVLLFCAALLPAVGCAGAGESAAPVAPAPAPVVAPAYYAEIAERMAGLLPDRHLTRSSLDDAVSARTWTNYLNALDFEHVYFTRQDIEGFAAERDRLDDALREGRLDFAFSTFEVFKDRMRDRHACMRRLLEREPDLDVKEYYRLPKRELPWPDEGAAWDDLWRRKIKNEYIRLQIAREMPPPAAGTNASPAAATNAVPPAAGAATNAPPSIPESILKRYEQVFTVLQDSDAEWVLQRYLTALATAYDPHSGYMSPSTVEDFDIEMKLSLVGIGALLRAEDGAAEIVSVIPGGPADRDKRDIRLRPGDRIIAVGQGNGPTQDILHWPLYKVVRLIRGKKGTTVALVVIPASDPSGATTRTVDLVRDEVKLEDQAASWKMHEVKDVDGEAKRLAVVTVPAFYANLEAESRNDPHYRSAAHDVARALSEAQAAGAHGVLLDLRNNGGGSLLEAIRMTGLFIRTGPTVMVRERSQVRVLPDTDPSVAYAGPLLVLVNRLSASASEIVAGALQDYGRAVIVGDSKTHGKGSVQSILELGRDRRLGSVKVTTALYYRVTGSSTQLRGVSPDILLPSPYDYMDLGEDRLPNAMEWSTVQPARFYPLDNLAETVEALRRRSDARRAADAQYQVYSKVLAQVEAINKSTEVPLAMEDRRSLARAEREMVELQRSLLPDGEDEENGEGNKNGKKDGGDRTDIVLREALQILGDYVALSAAKVQPARDGEPEKKSTAQIIADWFRLSR